MSFLVKFKTEETVKCEVVDGGELKSRRHLNVRGKSATLPSITGIVRLYLNPFESLSLNIADPHLSVNESHFGADKDWDDIKFGVDNKVDFYAVSFVKDAQVVHELKNYLKSKKKMFCLIFC